MVVDVADQTADNISFPHYGAILPAVCSNDEHPVAQEVQPRVAVHETDAVAERPDESVDEDSSTGTGAMASLDPCALW